MSTIHLTTQINAPIAVCFDMARDIDLHWRSCADTQERAVAGTVSGVIGLGETVTFEAVHFGVRQRLTGKIVEFEPPYRFVDEMVQGAFKCLRHVHEFRELGSETVMTDTITFTCPFGVIGLLIDKILIANHLHRLLAGRNRKLKEWAENGFDSKG